MILTVYIVCRYIGCVYKCNIYIYNIHTDGIINRHVLMASSWKLRTTALQDIKRGGNPAAMQHYHNEPLMLKISAAAKVPEMIHSVYLHFEVLHIIKLQPPEVFLCLFF